MRFIASTLNIDPVGGRDKSRPYKDDRMTRDSRRELNKGRQQKPRSRLEHSLRSPALEALEQQRNARENTSRGSSASSRRPANARAMRYAAEEPVENLEQHAASRKKLPPLRLEGGRDLSRPYIAQRDDERQHYGASWMAPTTRSQCRAVSRPLKNGCCCHRFRGPNSSGGEY